MRPSGIEDLTLRDLTPELVRQFHELLLDIAIDVPGRKWTLENLLLDAPRKWTLSFGYWSSTRPVAYAVLSAKSDAQAHLHHLMVHRDWRSRGLGALMLAEMERRARALGCPQLTLKVVADNTGGERFYARHGYDRLAVEGEHLIYARELLS